MSWQDQGRQEHGWFGSGTAAGHDDDAGLSGSDGLGRRIEAAGRGAVASLPRALRAQGERQLDAGSLPRPSEAMTAWSRGGRLDAAQFAERFIGRGADDAVVAQLRGAAQGVAVASGHAGLREAGVRLAGAMQAVGLDRWPGFLADAQARARDPATVAAVEASQPATRRHGVDAIRPVYPLEVLLGIGAAGVAGGVAGAARSAAGAVLRQFLPENGLPASATRPAGEGPEASGYKLSHESPASRPAGSNRNPPQFVINKGRQEKHIIGTNNYIPTRSTLTANPERLLKEFSGREKQVGPVAVGQPGSKEVFDANRAIGIYRTEEGQSAVTTRGIIHYSKQGTHIVLSAPRN